MGRGALTGRGALNAGVGAYMEVGGGKEVVRGG